jgi:16S rRNA (guanine527-N7)-methyltransferase
VFHVKREPGALIAEAASLTLSLDTGQAERLVEFERLLAGRAVDLGMVAALDRNRIRERHLLDCLRAATVVGDADRVAYDVGSGAGLPGIPVAIARPALFVHLVEPRRARVAFLELVVEQLRLENVAVLDRRVEDVVEPADVCFARAFAPVRQAWDAALPVLRAGGRLVYFAGARSGTVDPPPGCRTVEIVPPPANSVVESAGPLVIMTR